MEPKECLELVRKVSQHIAEENISIAMFILGKLHEKIELILKNMEDE